jgi:5-methylcytosine-specific restriction endonuclease McrA
MQYVLVVDSQKQPLMPCHPARARKLLKAGKAAVLRRYPFTLMLKERAGGAVQPVQVKLDPGSQQTGVAVVVQGRKGQRVVWAAEVAHRGQAIKAALDRRRALRRNRRQRKTRYRAARFDNRRKPDGWLPPSLLSRVANVETWVARLSRFTPVSSISLELVKFDTQAMQNPEIGGVEYQHGTLLGYEVREYLLEKWGRQCAYCGAKDTALEVEHLIPKVRGGSNRVSNLTLACRPCNLAKGSQTAAEFGPPEVQRQAQQSLKDAAAVNTTRWALYQRLVTTGLPIEVGTGGRTKFNRMQQGYPKAHWLDAACVGVSGTCVYVAPTHRPLLITATGHGLRQMCGTDQYGFPVRHRTRSKFSFGFQTGDLVSALVPAGKYAGTHSGRITIRNRPAFKLNGFDVHPNYLTLIQQADGYSYAKR